MKQYIITILILAQSIFCSCEDFLNVNPKSEVIDKDMFSTAEGFEDALSGVYASLVTENLYGSNLGWKIPEALSQDLILNSYRLAYQDFNYEQDVLLIPDLNAIWLQMYERIGYVNNILGHMEEDKAYPYFDLYKGEALGLRAFLHFELVRLFGVHINSPKASEPALPYVTNYSYNLTPLSSIPELYDFIIRDLKEAELLLEADQELFPISKNGGGKGLTKAREIHFNLHAAQAMLARIYWMKGELGKARLYAEKVIDSGQFELAVPTDIQKLVAGVLSPKETVWGLHTKDMFTYTEDYITSKSLEKATPYPNFRTTIYEDEAEDKRLEWFVDWREELAPNADMRCVKFLDLDVIENGVFVTGMEGFSMIRLPEMYYIVSEALLETDPDLAREVFLLVLNSRGINWDDTKELTLEEINKERRKEFFGEGENWFNMKRLNSGIYVEHYGNVVEGSDEIYALPIPQDEYEYRY